MAKARTETGDTERIQAVKLDVLLGVYRNRVLGETFRYSDLKEANVNGRYWERMGYLTIIRCGVKQLPDIYPYKD